MAKIMGKHAQSADNRVLDRIKQHGPGWVFTPADFSDLGSRTAVATALKRHKARSTIRQLARGLYDVPRQDKQLGLLSPSTEAVVEAIKNRDAVRLQPTGAYAANLLGLTEQVPVRIFFLTDGPERKIKLGRKEIVFKNTTPRNMATAGRISGLVIQALRWLGKRHVDQDMIKQLRARLDDEAKQQLLADVRHAPIWIAEIIRQIVD